MLNTRKPLPRCTSGNHTWLGEDDAAKCCNPEWKRVTVMAGDGLEPGDGRTAIPGLYKRWVRVETPAPHPGGHRLSIDGQGHLPVPCDCPPQT